MGHASNTVFWVLFAPINSIVFFSFSLFELVVDVRVGNGGRVTVEVKCV